MAAYLSEATGESRDPVLTESFAGGPGVRSLEAADLAGTVQRQLQMESQFELSLHRHRLTCISTLTNGRKMRLREFGLVEAIRDDQCLHEHIRSEAFRQRIVDKLR